MDSDLIASGGLVLDVLGFIMLLVFNPALKMVNEHLKTYVENGKSVLTIPDYTPDKARKLKLSIACHGIGIKLVISGFVLQLIANLLG